MLHEQGAFRSFRYVSEPESGENGTEQPKRVSIIDQLREIRDDINAGATESHIVAYHPVLYSRYYHTISKLLQLYSRTYIQQERLTKIHGRDLSVFWFYGSTGSGKTFAAKRSATKWIQQFRPKDGVTLFICH